MIEHYGSWKPQALAMLKTLLEETSTPLKDLHGAEVRPEAVEDDDEADLELRVTLPRECVVVAMAVVTGGDSRLEVLRWRIEGDLFLRCPVCRARCSVGRTPGNDGWELSCPNMACHNAAVGRGASIVDAHDDLRRDHYERYHGPVEVAVSLCDCGCGRSVEDHGDRLVYVDRGVEPRVETEIMWLEYGDAIWTGAGPAPEHYGTSPMANGAHPVSPATLDALESWMQRTHISRGNCCPACGLAMSAKRSKGGVSVRCENPRCFAVLGGWDPSSLARARFAARVAIEREANARCPRCNEMVHIEGSPSTGYAVQCRAPGCVRGRVGKGPTPDVAYAVFLTREEQPSNNNEESMQ
jgi:hypothetical protein